MTGMSRKGGAALSGVAHLKQSIQDILTTPIGTRVLRREYGSRIHELIDRPMNEETRVLIVSAVARALDRWEPRLRSVRISATIAQVQHGHLELSIVGYYRHNGEEILLDGIVV